MFCKECGQKISSEAKDPWCMYKVEGGQVINQLFNPDQIPEGWYDSPKAAKAGFDLAAAEDTQVKPDLKKPPKANRKGLNV